MVSYAIALICGISAYNFFPFFPVSIFILCVVASITLFITAHKTAVAMMFIFFTFGILYSFIRNEPLPDIKVPEGDVLIRGMIIDVPEISEGRLRFTINSACLNSQKIQGKVRLNILQELFMDDHSGLLFSPGNRISARAKLHRPGTYRNVGVHSYDLRKDGIIAVGYIRHMKIIGGGSGPLQWIFKKRQKLARIIDNSLNAENASFIKAIIPGLKAGINREMRDAFGITGLAHLLSISGTHFGLLSFIFFVCARTGIAFLPVKFLARMTLYITPSQAAVILTLPVLILYALISGMSIPTVRSLIMISILMTAILLGRKGQWLNSLAIASIIILLWQPGALFELSFQLSFLAVLSIGSLLDRKNNISRHSELDSESRFKNNMHISEILKQVQDDNRWRNLHRWIISVSIRAFDKLKTVVLMTVAAVFGTAPVAAAVFKQFTVISPITNLIVTPIVCFVILPLGFITGFSALLFDLQSMPLNGLIESTVHRSLRLIKFFSDIPFAAVRVPRPSSLVILLYFLSLFFIIKTRCRWRFLPFIIVICLYLSTPYLSGDNLRITFLDVGQGDAAVVELPDGKVMLVDGGSLEPDTGRSVIAPYLWSKGITGIDYIAVSHPHPDHYGGLLYIMDNFNIGEVWTNGRAVPEAEELYQKIRDKKIPCKIIRRGSFMEGSDYRIFVFHPYDTFYPGSSRGEYSDQNNDSLTFKIEHGNMSVLFTGDIEKEAEEDLISLGRWLKSDIIKVPHHGAGKSSSEEFIKIVEPRTAVISAGRNNMYNHPHKETLKRYRSAGGRIFRTDISGSVTIISKDNFYEIQTYEDGRFKKVKRWGDEVRNLKLLF